MINSALILSFFFFCFLGKIFFPLSKNSMKPTPLAYYNHLTMTTTLPLNCSGTWQFCFIVNYRNVIMHITTFSNIRQILRFCFRQSVLTSCYNVLWCNRNFFDKVFNNGVLQASKANKFISDTTATATKGIKSKDLKCTKQKKS